jgi:adenylosuccinate lyase
MAPQFADSPLFQNQFGTPEMRAVFEEQHTLQKWLDVEVALARAEAEAGLIPVPAAEVIAQHAQAQRFDLDRMKTLLQETGHPLMPLILLLSEACGEAGAYVHWGATTQDILDTGAVLQIKEAYGILASRLAGIRDRLCLLAAQHRDSIMAGRTHGQHALPISFGYKVAVWIAEIERHLDRLDESRARVLVGQFAGAVGTLASLGASGLDVQQRMMRLLDLGQPLVAWHTARDAFAEFTVLLAMIAATAGKIGNEVTCLQRTEIGELEEPFVHGNVGSSTMPHKRNPVVSEGIVSLARMVAARTPTMIESLIHEHERDFRAWQSEWVVVPETCVMTDGALALLDHVIAGMRVNTQRMSENVRRGGGLMLSEAVMLALGKRIGRQAAHEAVYACCMQAIETQQSFQAALCAHPEVAAHLTVDEIEKLLDPEAYLGLSAVFVDRVLDEVKRKRAPKAG